MLLKKNGDKSVRKERENCYFLGSRKASETSTTVSLKLQPEIAVWDVKVSVYPKFDDFSKKLFFTFSDRSYCNLSFKKNSMKKD